MMAIKKRYARLADTDYKIFSEAVEKKISYEVKCPQLVICGKEDRRVLYTIFESL